MSFDQWSMAAHSPDLGPDFAATAWAVSLICGIASLRRLQHLPGATARALCCGEAFCLPLPRGWGWLGDVTRLRTPSSPGLRGAGARAQPALEWLRSLIVPHTRAAPGA